ncbi:hypothetical protein VP01_34g2 [Puccinia sorghi]|uniref:Uncharacterized protein n=1 Tax=Puccinia sorghi TaxID=27349 RepID=A0A0L6UVR1_9BASI|nr:hypothetical protein VP01_34g2 [Puccinia sorghi]
MVIALPTLSFMNRLLISLPYHHRLPRKDGAVGASSMSSGCQSQYITQINYLIHLAFFFLFFTALTLDRSPEYYVCAANHAHAVASGRMNSPSIIIFRINPLPPTITFLHSSSQTITHETNPRHHVQPSTEFYKHPRKIELHAKTIFKKLSYDPESDSSVLHCKPKAPPELHAPSQTDSCARPTHHWPLPPTTSTLTISGFSHPERHDIL